MNKITRRAKISISAEVILMLINLGLCFLLPPGEHLVNVFVVASCGIFGNLIYWFARKKIVL